MRARAAVRVCVRNVCACMRVACPCAYVCVSVRGCVRVCPCVSVCTPTGIRRHTHTRVRRYAQVSAGAPVCIPVCAKGRGGVRTRDALCGYRRYTKKANIQ
jgi:hypothetical protein